jgi:hypothetical protein
MWRAPLILCVSVSTLLVTIAARAADPAAEPAGVALRQEWVGLEIVPLSFNLGSARSGESPTRFQAGPGGALRLLRHRWNRVYWTPVHAGLFVGLTRGETIFTHVHTEGGYIVRAGPRTLELGMGVGAGILGIKYAENGCDGSCYIGGAGPMLFPVARLLVRDGPRFTLGFVLRGAIPLHVPSGEWIATTARGFLFLGGLDLAVGAGR